MLSVNSALDLFERPGFCESVEKSTFSTFQPLASLEGSGNIDYFIPGSSSDYIDLNSLQLQVRVKILLASGANLPAGAEVSTANLLLHSLFQKVDCYLNDTLVSCADPTYAFRSYLTTVVNYGAEAKMTQLTTQGYVHDETGTVEGMMAAGKSGYKARKALIAESQSVELMGKLSLDVANIDRYLLNNIDMKISLVRSKPEFVVISTDVNASYKIFIESAVLHVRKVKISPDILLAHATVLQSTPAIYPFTQTVLKTFSIPAGLFDVVRENLFLGKTPVRILLGLVSSKALNGAYSENPFNFGHFNLNYCSFSMDGESLPSLPFTPDFARNLYAREYLSLFRALGIMDKNESHGITYQSFKNGSFFIALDLTADMTSDSPDLEIPKHSNLSLHLKFSEPLAENLTAILLGEFEAVIQIDKNRVVTTSSIS